MATGSASRFGRLALAIGLVGVVLRLWGFGAYGFWNDEAWVAISTRVTGVGQTLLALSVTPLGWGLLLRPLALAGPPEVSLRSLALGFGVATMWLAWRLGNRLAGHPAGGLFALALVALDPVSVVWSQQLKQYSAEAALALLAVLAAMTVARRGRAVDVAGLAVVLTLGMALSNAQLLVAPPLLVVLGGHALLTRDRAELRRIAIAAAVVGLWDLAWFVVLIRPWLTPAMHTYWSGQYPPLTSARALGSFLHASGVELLAPALGPYGVWIALAGLIVLLATRDGRLAALALLLLATQLVVLSIAHQFPLGVQRVNLFLTTLLLVTTGAAAGHIVADLWTRSALRPLAIATVGLFAAAVMSGHASSMTQSPLPEDVGPLMRQVEMERAPGDRVLLYERSAFVWGYYRSKPPVLLPAPALANGFIVALDDPAVIVVRGNDAEQAAARALAGAPRVWFVGSRLVPGDEAHILRALAVGGRIVRQERRPRALLALVEPR